jgi:hypothetical protein
VPEIRADGGFGYKRDRDGKRVNSRLEDAALRRLAQETGGAYYTASLDGSEVAAIAGRLRKLAAGEGEALELAVPENRYQWPLAAAIALLSVELLLSGGRFRPRERGAA